MLDAIRGKDVTTALAILAYNPRYASSVTEKLLKSAIANAENNNGLKAENLYIGVPSATSSSALAGMVKESIIARASSRDKSFFLMLVPPLYSRAARGSSALIASLYHKPCPFV